MSMQSPKLFVDPSAGTLIPPTDFTIPLRVVSSRIVASAALFLSLTACADRDNNAVAPTPAKPTAAITAVLNCTGNATAISCESDGASTAVGQRVDGLNLDVVLGGQNTYVQLAQVSSTFNATTNQLSAVVSVRNLTDQPLGTSDGTTLDPDAVRIFFHSGPTNGVTLVNADGSGTFTASNQSYYKYNEIIPAGATDATGKTWIFQLPSATTTFSFQVYVVGPRPDESAPVTLPPHTFEQLSAGSSGNRTCAIRSGGASYCWGQNFGQLGDGTTINRSVPTGMIGTVKLVRISHGGVTCGLDASGKAYCMGRSDHGEFGNGAVTASSNIPVPVTMPAGVAFSAIAVGQDHTCAVSTAGRVYCWGWNRAGEVGDNTTIARTLPTSVVMPTGVTFTALAISDINSCALSSTGSIYCWGHGAAGKLGNPDPLDPFAPNKLIPTRIQTTLVFTKLVYGGGRGCALSTAGVVYCWGSNSYSSGNGALGDGTTVDSRSTPTAVVMPAGVTFNSLGSGVWHTCAVSTTGVVYCWGNGIEGQLGNGTTAVAKIIPTMIAMPAGVTFSTVTAGLDHTCAMSSTGTAYCWGSGQFGEMGNGYINAGAYPVITDRFFSPVAVLMP